MPKEFQSFYKTVHTRANSMCPYTTRLDTYGRGCQHNCAYCYDRAAGLWQSEGEEIGTPDVPFHVTHANPTRTGGG